MILCEDKYGVGFFKELTKRMKHENLIPNLHVSVAKFYGACNPKIERQMKAMAYLRNFDFFIIVVDADGKPERQLEEKIQYHISTKFTNSTRTVVLKYEIEDWLFISMGFPHTLISVNNKPSVILKEKKGYEKYKLKHNVPKLDFTRLIEECKSFCKFVECLNECSER
jgi:hypothetical protein